jgi:transketolase
MSTQEATQLDQTALDQLSINTIRILSIDAVQKANSGHPGLPMGAAAMAYVLWTRFLKYNPKDPNWPDRDRFVLSAGHGAMLLYSLLHLTGYDLSLDELKHFRQFGSKTPGHPERGHAPGVEVATGPLGQGFAMGVGMAITEAWLAANFNREGHKIFDHYTYAIVSDGDLMEGVASEAASLAGHLKLGKLIYLYDQNHISLAGATDLSFTENVAERFDAYGWHTKTVEDGNDTEAIAAAIREAQAETERPSLILAHTHIGFGSPNKQDTYHAHGSPLGEEEVAATKKNLGWPTMDSFFLPQEAVDHFRQQIPKGDALEKEWKARFEAYKKAFPEDAKRLETMLAGKLPDDFAADLPKWKPGDKAVATRVAAGQALSALAKRIPNLIGGSADLNPSTNTALKDGGDFEPAGSYGGKAAGTAGGPWSFAGRNIHFGVREHAMGAAVNGMAAHGGVIPYSATFLTFSDYMKPAIRLGALMDLHTVYVFTHDSIGLGEDGPTHQPVEHLAGLRAIPNLTVIRPADANESAEAWKLAVTRNHPSLFALSRQNLPILERIPGSEDGLAQGAYILSDPEGGKPDVILIGTGSEVSLCVKARERLKGYGVQARVVSMPSWRLFEEQSEEYQEKVLPKALRKRVTVEAGVTQGWTKWATSDGVTIGINHFGASAPGEVVMKEFGFTAEHVTSAALRLMGRDAEAEKEFASNGDTGCEPTPPTEGHS